MNVLVYRNSSLCSVADKKYLNKIYWNTLELFFILLFFRTEIIIGFHLEGYHDAVFFSRSHGFVTVFFDRIFGTVETNLVCVCVYTVHFLAAVVKILPLKSGSPYICTGSLLNKCQYFNWQKKTGWMSWEPNFY